MPGSRLSLEERVEVQAGLRAGESVRRIAWGLGRAASTISREVSRNGNSRGVYTALGAQRKAQERARRPKRRRLDDARLRGRVRRLVLEERHSPMTASRLLAAQGCGISHEAIYQEIYRGGFGDPRTVLCRPRRSRRRRTRTGRYPDNLGDYRRLADRPGDPRAEQGHWEGDLLVGHDNKTATVVITDRYTRKTLLGALPKGRNADHVAEVVTRMLIGVPAEMRRSLTWDQGREFTRWTRIEAAAGTPIYFTEPRSPWQKPLVENQNGLLRRWLPRNQPMPANQPVLDRIAHRINTIPRRVLNWSSANDAYDRLAAATTD
jgi:transposase, IS30 family